MSTVSAATPTRLIRKPSSEPQMEAPFDRIEFQAQPEWVRDLDRAAEAVGLSRSAYIRLAVSKLVAADRRERGILSGVP
jgi:hypothetical protein